MGKKCKLIFLSAAVLSLSSAALADKVMMKNGDRVTGVIVKKDGKDLTIKTEQFGTVTAAWDQVESVEADKPVTVVLPGGKTVLGTVATVDGKLEIATGAEKVDVTPADVSTIRNGDEQKAFERLDHPSWTHLWAGTGSIGFAGTSGNARTLTYTTGISAARLTRHDNTSLYFNTIKASAFANGKNSDTAQAVRGGIGYDHNVSNRLFVNAFNDYEYDKFQNLDLRFVAGGGFGYHWVKNAKSTLDVLGGGDYNRSKYSTPATQNSAEAFWGDAYSRKLSSSTGLTQNFRMFNDLTKTGDYRVNMDLGVSAKIAKWLNWNISLSDRYLNHPAFGRKTNDFLYTTGLGITFAR